MLFTLIYRANPGDKAHAGDQPNAGDIRIPFHRLSLADAEHYAETLLKDRGVWASRNAQLRHGNNDKEKVVSLHSTWGGAWIHPNENLIKKPIHQYTAQAYVDSHLMPKAFTAENFQDAQRIALEFFSFETTIWLHKNGKFIARRIPGKGWVRSAH